LRDATHDQRAENADADEGREAGDAEQAHRRHPLAERPDVAEQTLRERHASPAPARLAGGAAAAGPGAGASPAGASRLSSAGEVAASRSCAAISRA
jgi:hypothetical protein